MKKKAIPAASRRAVLEREVPDHGEYGIVRCHYCGAEGSYYRPVLTNGEFGAWVHFSLEMDHVIPESAGGSNDPENLVLACRSCNRRKGAKV